MTRTSLLDKIHSRDFDKDKEITKANKIIAADSNLHYYLGRAYLNSKYNTSACNYKDLYDDLFGNALNSKDINGFLDYFEFLINLLSIIYEENNKTSRSEQLLDNIKEAMCLAGYKFIVGKEKYLEACLIDEKVEIVAENVEPSIKDHIYNYLTIRTGDVENKRRVVRDLCDDVEVYCKKSKNDDIRKLKQFYQCVRHTKEKPIKEFPFYYENEEKWLDEIFNMIVDVLAMKDLGIRIEEVNKKEKLSINKE